MAEDAIVFERSVTPMATRQVIAIIICCLAITGAANAQAWPADKKTYVLQGPVKSVRTETIKHPTSEEHPSPIDAVPDEEIYFDEKGRVISHISHYHNATVLKKGDAFFNTFDSQGKLRRIKLALPGEAPYAEVVVSYSENDRRVVLDYTLPNGVVYYRYSHLLNEHGKLIEKSSGQLHTGPESFESYTYDHQGRLIEAVRLDKNKRLLHRETISFEDKTRTSTHCSYDAEGKLKLKIVKCSDEQGAVIETATFDGNNRLVRKAHLNYKFDQFGNWIEAAALPDSSDTTTAPYYQRRVITYYK